MTAGDAPPAPRRHALVLGGARSGKTARAQAWAEALGPARVYLATAQAFDDEMADRIARHQAERGAGWATLETPLDLPAAVASAAAAPGPAAADVLLVDCLTLWLSNLMHHDRDPEAETAALLSALAGAPRPVILVSNELGLGLVPETPLGRAFRDAQGRLNQAVAAAVDDVVFVAAGLPLVLKGRLPA
ncbi:bifunctional adenosylcobinamide kinase/adenosylcobinamide-phosphate guanylyltransferase [Albimonas sp. CAU 1670]|uniref:bifunctional adenosylcobinamide kinase/adenosylcobinamide-phosphate guanylyltransferase n=1 Tax=Albimonas sp. CAU 1670 TaxID=3032599 RepID=UPI0023DBE12C|nr:bifunctional adenosylcobinamide kinase/adenosylcobinamide-phosphate guanylyltransferase [Albimonas sp. CAU 1670]MDF2234211.1 bifunctional adenosylcobinamide kinase/adenosylcobinamide-phosphate guanylyltransferase [Albimonas sp. CAU 1670]